MKISNIKSIIIAGCLICSANSIAQSALNDTLNIKEHEMKEIVVVKQREGTTRINSAMNGFQINKSELFKAACCNLGESFSTNPSVDVNYNDATTGARQIKLLGLAGTYVQMLTETMPNFRSSSSPYALSYVPGPWMKSIQVSKGAASVKNGYESITGQINIQYLQPEDEEGITINLYGSTMARFEDNADANLHINDRLSTELLLHHENEYSEHDGNDDGFIDMPKIKQWNAQNRWAYLGDRYIFHAGVGILKENRDGGQVEKHITSHDMPLYKIGIETNRYEAYMKHAFVLDKVHGTNIALMASGTLHEMNSLYGFKKFDTNDKNAYASLMYETNFTPKHNLSIGASMNHDYIKNVIERYPITKHDENGNINDDYLERTKEGENYKETTWGGYAQYTYTQGTRWTAMAGVRLDHSSAYGTFFTPRMHIKYSPNSIISLRLSLGKGYRTVHALNEYGYLLASGRKLIIEYPLKQEEAWNYGLSTALNIPIANKTLKLNAEYYYTDFSEQAVVDYDTNIEEIRISNLKGRSYSHTMQVDATYELFKGLSLTAAYRRNIVKTTYNGIRMEKPLNNRYKALLTASYKTPLGLWQFDATLQLNGGGRMPQPYATDEKGTLSWQPSFKSYEQVNLQITRWFRHFSIYLGGENLTNFRQKNPIINANEPFSTLFEPTMVWGPVRGAMGYLGIRINIGRL